jgi:hypothetical protein
VSGQMSAPVSGQMSLPVSRRVTLRAEGPASGQAGGRP